MNNADLPQFLKNPLGFRAITNPGDTFYCTNCKFLEIKPINIKWEPGKDTKVGGYIVLKHDGKYLYTDTIILFEAYLEYTSADIRINFIETLIHEARHAWQAANNIFSYEIMLDSSVYSPSEIDARAFSYLFIEYFVVDWPEVYDTTLRRLLVQHRDCIITDFLRRAYEISEYES